MGNRSFSIYHNNCKRTLTKNFKTWFLLIGTVFLFTHCSTSKMVSQESSYEKNIVKINYLGSKYSSQIFLIDNTIINASYINMSKDSLSFIGVENDIKHTISNSQLYKITIKDSIAKIFGGLWVGIGTGCAGILLGSASDDYGPVIVGAIATAIGFVAGYFISGDKVFLFNDSGHY